MNFDIGNPTIYYTVIDDSGATGIKILFGATAAVALILGVLGHLWLRRRGTSVVRALWPLIVGVILALGGAFAIGLINSDLDTIRDLRANDEQLHSRLNEAAGGETVHIVSNEDSKGRVSDTALSDMYAEAMRGAVQEAAHTHHVDVAIEQQQSPGVVSYTLTRPDGEQHCETTYAPAGDATRHATAHGEGYSNDIWAVTMDATTTCAAAERT